jgi:hypothetical protein
MKRFLILSAFIISLVAFSIIPNSYAQNFEIIDGVELETNEVITIFGIGILAALMRSFINLGNEKPYDKIHAAKNIASVIIATIPIAFTASMTTDMNLLGYIFIFFAAYGGGAAIQNVNIRESVVQVKEKLQKDED